MIYFNNCLLFENVGSDDIRAHDSPKVNSWRPLSADLPLMRSIYDEPSTASERVTGVGYRYLPVHRETYGYSPRPIYSHHYGRPSKFFPYIFFTFFFLANCIYSHGSFTPEQFFHVHYFFTHPLHTRNVHKRFAAIFITHTPNIPAKFTNFDVFNLMSPLSHCVILHINSSHLYRF